jgi:hypothetical protein
MHEVIRSEGSKLGEKRRPSSAVGELIAFSLEWEGRRRDKNDITMAAKQNRHAIKTKSGAVIVETHLSNMACPAVW